MGAASRDTRVLAAVAVLVVATWVVAMSLAGCVPASAAHAASHTLLLSRTRNATSRGAHFRRTDFAMRQQAEDDPAPDNNQDRYARSAPAPREAQSAPVTPTVLVFRDQHQEEVRNYAIVGQTLWSFSPQHTQKIPLSDLDLAATTKANDDRGLTFRVPAPGEGQ